MGTRAVAMGASKGGVDVWSLLALVGVVELASLMFSGEPGDSGKSCSRKYCSLLPGTTKLSQISKRNIVTTYKLTTKVWINLISVEPGGMLRLYEPMTVVCCTFMSLRRRKRL